MDAHGWRLSQQGGKLVGSGGMGASAQGCAVSLSSDGNTAMVGRMGDSEGTGAAWVWKRSGEVWMQQGKKQVGADATGNSDQGGTVSISSDGNTLIVGGIGDNDYSGAAWIFTQSASPILPKKPAAPKLLRKKNDLLHFEVPQFGKVVMKIFDANGRIAATLLDESRNAGLYDIPLPTERDGVFGIVDYSAGNYHETLAIHPE